ncbi:MAG: YaaL family protein [Eubacterium sp.]|nr:YaaL family protein [Eubacterium sp.]
MFPFFKQEPKPDETYQNLLDNLMLTKKSLDLAYQNFENATDPELIDSYIYEVNAIQKRYKFLLCRLKSYETADS